ncbi:DUF4230 domain-containing protein [Ferruginibacter sp. HRS2-29]|uniref:DUF4230 domain-containing protein n=1 Tax=Ferruginibacter sp. HRS2-29 TaxID=2487334 RepID=UPI0020CD90D6|nr:DUF4230 domain-containing protein [Ferruginibacter sp. HRS2-29]MCP9753247.1 DUF4230 domain-containing protein [Ferruginibacter sp. HRS2-29]
MRNNLVIIVLILLVAFAFYFLGKKNGSNITKTDVVHNVEMIKEIAELSALDVYGTTQLTMTNRGDNPGMWSKFKNYFAESTLRLAIPYEAKYGVDMTNQKVEINTKAGTAIIYLPECKLLSLQLKLDKVDAITKTGVLNTITVDEYIKAQKQLYEEANKTLVNNPNAIKLAKDHIRVILEKYYKPMGLKVELVFWGKATLQ